MQCSCAIGLGWEFILVIQVLIKSIFNVLLHMQTSVQVMVDNYLEKDEVQKEMASTSVK